MTDPVQLTPIRSRPSRAATCRGIAVLVVLALAVTLGGCGSKKQPQSQPESSSAWAQGVCSSVSTWKSSVTNAAKSVVSGGVSKESLSAAANSATQATATLESSLKGLGKPNTATGQQAQGIVDQLTSSLTADTATIRSTVDAASGIRGLVTAAPTVARTLSSMQTQVTTAVTSIKQLDPSGELATAFAQSPSC